MIPHPSSHPLDLCHLHLKGLGGLPFLTSSWHHTCDHGLVDSSGGCSQVGGLRRRGLHLVESVSPIDVVRAELFGQLPKEKAPHEGEEGIFWSQEEGAGVGAVEMAPAAHLGDIDLREHPSVGEGVTVQTFIRG